MSYENEVEPVLAIARVIGSAFGQCNSPSYRFQSEHATDQNILYAAYVMHMAHLYEYSLEEMFEEMQDNTGQVNLDFPDWLENHKLQRKL